MSIDKIVAAFVPLRNALAPQGTANVTCLRLKPGCAVSGDVPQEAIDEIIKFHTLGKSLGEEESACMKLAKMLLMDSAYIEMNSKPKSDLEQPHGQRT